MVSVMLYYKTLRMASMKIQHIQNAVNQGLKLTYIHCWIASPLKNPISFIVALFPAASSCPYKPSLTDLWFRCNINPKNAVGFYFSGQTQDLSQRQGKAGWTKPTHTP